MEKPERYKQLEERVWQNLNQSGLLPKILEKSSHAASLPNYDEVDIYTEFQWSDEIKEYAIWIQIFINHKEPYQPVTPKIYRLTEDKMQQQNISEQIWKGITEEDIKFITKSSAEKYSNGDRWMNISQKTKMEKFLPALKENRVCVQSFPDYAQYAVYVKE